MTSSSIVSSVSIVQVSSSILASISFAFTFPFSDTSASADSSSALSMRSVSRDSVSATTFSASSIVKFLKSENRSLSVETIYNYLKWLSEAFIIYPCKRYDLQGKAVLKTQEKYYLSDISIKYCQMGFDRKMLSAVFENIIYLEMKRRGYDVYIGKNNTKEIDFVGVRKNEKIYIQVSVEMPTESTRETDNLMKIKDHYHK